MILLTTNKNKKHRKKQRDAIILSNSKETNVERKYRYSQDKRTI